MNARILLPLGFLLAAGLSVSCGGDDTGETSSTTGGTTGGALVNDCDAATAEDHTADAVTTIAFGGAVGNNFSPACVKIAKGNGVKFVGQFAVHPLYGGTATDSKETPDPSSPIKETTADAMGMAPPDVTFTFPNAGAFPFYCLPHGTLGMRGAVFVE